MSASRRAAGRRAGVALMFAITVLPLAGLIGLAIDFGFVLQAKARLNLASDTAALSATVTAANAFTANKTNYIALGTAAGQQWFVAQAGSIDDSSFSAPSVQVVQSGSKFTSTVSYQGKVNTFFGPLFGVSTINLGGTSTVTITTQAYVAVSFLLDNSSSMLIAATAKGVDDLAALTKAYTGYVPSNLGNLRCAFACHWDNNNQDFFGLARNNNIQLRFDVLQTAVQAAISQMKSQQKSAGQFSVGISTFDLNLKRIYPVSQAQSFSTNLDGAISAAQALQSPVVIDSANTGFPDVMAQLAKGSTAAGDGSSAATPKKALIIVTDGMSDYGARNIPQQEGPIKPADCDAIKALGYSVYVLYTPFIVPAQPKQDDVLLNNAALLTYINGTGPTGMLPSLQACASSPQNLRQASDPADITVAMTQLLQAAIGNGGRFTN